MVAMGNLEYYQFHLNHQVLELVIVALLILGGKLIVGKVIVVGPIQY